MQFQDNSRELTDLLTEAINAVNDAIKEEWRDRYEQSKIQPKPDRVNP